MSLKEKIENIDISDNAKFFIKIGVTLAVIIVIIVLINAIVNKDDSNNDYDDIKEITIEATKEYVNRNNDLIAGNYGTSDVTVTTLVNGGYMKELSASCGGYVTVLKNDGFYSYIPKIDCGEGYIYQNLTDVITSKENIVTSGNGLYRSSNDELVFKGDSVNNYVSYAGKVWRILRIETDGAIRLVEESTTTYSTWDNRYNSESNYSSGNNKYEGIVNSRIKDAIIKYYTEKIADEDKSLVVPQEFCVGARTEKDISTDGKTECKTKSELMSAGGMIVAEYLSASLDPTCVYINSKGCGNYNYIANFYESFWLITPVSGTTYKAYYLSRYVYPDVCSNSKNIRLVLTISNKVNYNGGNGKKDNPYIIKGNI